MSGFTQKVEGLSMALTTGDVPAVRRSFTKAHNNVERLLFSTDSDEVLEGRAACVLVKTGEELKSAYEALGDEALVDDFALVKQDIERLNAHLPDGKKLSCPLDPQSPTPQS